MTKAKWIFPFVGLFFIVEGLLVNLPKGNYVWFVYDLLLGIWCIVLPFLFFV